MHVRQTIGVIVIALCCIQQAVLAESVQTFGDDFDGWTEAAGEVTQIDFAGLGNLTPVDEQYSDLGVQFPGADWTFFDIDVPDEFTLRGLDEIHLTFEQPRSAIAVDYLGAAAFELYNNGELIYPTTGNPGFSGFDGVVEFGGVVSEEPFDEVYIRNFQATPEGLAAVVIDNLYFNNPIPAAPSFALLGFALVRRRRRCRE